MEKQKVAARPVLPIHERRAIRQEEGAKAWAEYQKEQERTRANTERLRQLRLSKDK